MKTLAIISAVSVALVAGFTVGIRTESVNHAYDVSRLTGTPYGHALDSWNRLQLTDGTDTDTQHFDKEVGLDSEENCDGVCEANQN